VVLQVVANRMLARFDVAVLQKQTSLGERRIG